VLHTSVFAEGVRFISDYTQTRLESNWNNKTTALGVYSPTYVGPCQHCVARLRGAGAGDGIMIWRVTANTAYKG